MATTLSSMQTELISLRAAPATMMETQSGLFSARPLVFGALRRALNSRVAAILMHPTSNFHGHYLLGPLAERGITTLALNSRYVNNDATLIMERVLLDLAAGVAHLREQGFEKIALIGNSGGGALMATYQAAAEAQSLPLGDGVALIAAHPGRARFFTNCLDAAVEEEGDPYSLNPGLNIFDPSNPPPFSTDFLASIEKRQRERNERITLYAKQRINDLRRSGGPASDQAFIIHRTAADPRFVDLSLDENDRPAGTIWGDARAVNAAANGTARFTTCTSFLSQWSLETTRADGPENLSRTHVPVLILEYTADAAVFPSDTQSWRAACEGRYEYHAINGATHYLVGQPDKAEEVADTTAEWILALR